MFLKIASSMSLVSCSKQSVSAPQSLISASLRLKYRLTIWNKFQRTSQNPTSVTDGFRLREPGQAVETTHSCILQDPWHTESVIKSLGLSMPTLSLCTLASDCLQSHVNLRRSNQVPLILNPKGSNKEHRPAPPRKQLRAGLRHRPCPALGPH